MFKLQRRVVIFTLLASLSLTAYSQDLYPVSGRISDSNGALIPRAAVTLSPTHGGQRINALTDNDGKFFVGRINAGEYSITVHAEGFATQTFEMGIDEDRQLEIVLTPRRIAAEVSVSASYLAGSRESLREVPGSIDRIDAGTLDASRVFNFSEALRKIAGVNVREEEGFGLRPNIGIRGTNPTRSTKVLLLEDGIPLAYAPYGDNASYYHPPIERYESIEVLKGSSQIAYGPQTIAGVINYLTPHPSAKPTLSLSMTGGNRSYFNGSLAGGATIGRTGVFAHYARKQGKGSRENTHSKLNDLAAKIVQTVNDRHAITLKGSYYGEDSNVTYSGLTLAEYLAAPRSNPFANDFFYGDRSGFSASHTAVLSTRASLTTNAYLNTFKRHWWRQSSNSGQRPNRLNVDPDCNGMAQLNTTCGNEGRLRTYATYGIEPRFTFNYDAGNLFSGEMESGLRFHWEDQRRRQLNGEMPNSRDGLLAEANLRHNFARSAYVQHRFLFGALAITPGVRYENIQIERENLLTGAASIGQTAISALIPGIGFAYSRLPRTTVFGGVHRGFSPPRAEDIISNSGGVVDLEPEASWNFELGVRTAPFTGVKVEATFFRLDYENQIVPASLAGGTGALLTNGGETLQQGAELSASFDSGAIFSSKHNIYFRGAFTWLPVAAFRGIRFSSAIPSINVSGNRLPYVPQRQATYSIGYSHPVGLNAFIENVYLSGQFSDDLNTLVSTANGQRGFIDAQSYLNGTVNYSIEKIRTTFYISAKNLGDKTLIVDRSRGILPSIGRNIQTGLKIRF